MRIKIALTVAVLATVGVSGQDRPQIGSAGELPNKIFTTPIPASQLLQDDRFVTELAPQLREEAERVRDRYEITDPATAVAVRSGLAAIAVLQHRSGDADALIKESRSASSKPQDRAIGLLPADIASAAMASRVVNCSAGAARLRTLLAGTDASIVRDDVLGRYSQIETTSAAFLIGLAAEQIEPGTTKRGGITLLEGMRLASWRMQIEALPPCRGEYATVIRAWLAAPGHEPTDIWPARQPAPTEFATARPVTVAVWDGGIDTTLFGGQLARDPAEPLDGRDNDGNGVIDDWAGPTFGNRLEPISTPLAAPSLELARQLAFQMALTKGERDLQFGYDTPEAELFARRSREAGPADQAADARLWEEMAYRNHGTGVASIIADGAPYVRLYNAAALPFGREPRAIPLDEAQLGRWIAIIGRMGARLRSAGVRVVNMSWGITADEIATSLSTVGSEVDQDRAKSRGKELYGRVEAALRKLVSDCPEILFVIGAGNSDQPAEIFQAMPQSIVAPNVLVVGATGTSGRPTSFTTFGRNVSVYALGEAVPVRWPGGMRARSSGTSEAAPQVTRAAAGMLAVRPSLKVADLVRGLKDTATDGEGGIKLLQIEAAIRWAKAR